MRIDILCLIIVVNKILPYLEQLKLVSLFIVVPPFCFIGLAFHLNSEKFESRPEMKFQVIFNSRKFIITTHLITKIVYLAFLYGRVDLIAPSSLAVIIVIVAMFPLKLLKGKLYDPAENQTETMILISKLSSVETNINEVINHVSILQGDLANTQEEVTKTASIKLELDREVQRNKQDAELWTSMSEEQRNAVSTVATNAISKNMRKDFWRGLARGVLLNILASFVWSLINNPSKQDFLKFLKDLYSKGQH